MYFNMLQNLIPNTVDELRSIVFLGSRFPGVDQRGIPQADFINAWYNRRRHIGSIVMIRIILQADVAEQIRRSDGQVELVDEMGNRLGVVRRPPTDEEIRLAKSRMGKSGPKVSFDELIARVESL